MNDKVCKNSLYTALIFDFLGICLMLFNYFVYNKDFWNSTTYNLLFGGLFVLLLCKNYFKKDKKYTLCMNKLKQLAKLVQNNIEA